MKKDIYQKIEEVKIVPVVKLERAEDAANLGNALCEGGIPVAEVTFRTDAACESIRKMKQACPQMLVGAGTVVNLEQAKQALDAGAEFIVTPGVSEPVIQFSADNKIPVFPGICTPSELIMAMAYGLKVVKFFPAEQYGGLNTIEALGGPFPDIRFMPTGGINPDNIKTYLASKKVIACGGSWMVKDALINEKAFDKITELSRAAIDLIK